MKKTCRICSQYFFEEEIHKRFCKRPIFAGFSNEGTNNCFLNSALQILYHIKTFRQLVVEFNPKCRIFSDHDCIVCAIKRIFDQYQILEGRKPILDANDLRFQLAKAYSKQNKYKLRETADAMECMTAI